MISTHNVRYNLLQNTYLLFYSMLLKRKKIILTTLSLAFVLISNLTSHAQKLTVINNTKNYDIGITNVEISFTKSKSPEHRNPSDLQKIEPIKSNNIKTWNCKGSAIWIGWDGGPIHFADLSIWTHGSSANKNTTKISLENNWKFHWIIPAMPQSSIDIQVSTSNKQSYAGYTYYDYTVTITESIVSNKLNQNDIQNFKFDNNAIEISNNSEYPINLSVNEKQLDLAKKTTDTIDIRDDKDSFDFKISNPDFKSQIYWWSVRKQIQGPQILGSKIQPGMNAGAVIPSINSGDNYIVKGEITPTYTIETATNSYIAKYKLVINIEKNPIDTSKMDPNDKEECHFDNVVITSNNIPEYNNLIDFQNAQTKNLAKLKRCSPSGCESLFINDAEEILVLLILLGNVPFKDKDGFFELAKIDHDEAVSIAKIVFGEGKSYFTEFDYEKFDLNKMADIFDSIADLSDEIWGQTILVQAQDILFSSHTEDNWRASIWPLFAEKLNQRKAQCRAFALSLRCQAAVGSNDLKAIQNLIELGFDPNTPSDCIHIDSVQEKNK